MSKKIFSTLAVAAFAQVQAASHAGAAPMAASAASAASAAKHMDKKEVKPPMKKEEKK